MVRLGGWLREGWEIVADDWAVFAGAIFVAWAIAIVSLGICAGPMVVGLFMMVHAKLRGDIVSISDLFDGLEMFWQSLGASFLIMTAVAVPGWILRSLDLQYLTFVLFIPVGGAMFFTFQIIADRGAGAIEAISMSWEKTRQDYLMFCVAFFVYNLIARLGLLVLVVGVLLTYALMFAAMGAAYWDVFDVAETTGTSDRRSRSIPLTPKDTQRPSPSVERDREGEGESSESLSPEADKESSEEEREDWSIE